MRRLAWCNKLPWHCGGDGLRALWMRFQGLAVCVLASGRLLMASSLASWTGVFKSPWLTVAVLATPLRTPGIQTHNSQSCRVLARGNQSTYSLRGGCNWKPSLFLFPLTNQAPLSIISDGIQLQAVLLAFWSMLFIGGIKTYYFT